MFKLLLGEVATDWTSTVATGGTVAAIVAIGVALNQIINIYRNYLNTRQEAAKQAALDNIEVEEKQLAVDTKQEELDARRKAQMNAEYITRIQNLEDAMDRVRHDHMDCEKAHAQCTERVNNLERRLGDVETRYTNLRRTTGLSGTEMMPPDSKQ